MTSEITLEEVALRAHQAEIICSMMEVYPNQLVDSEITAMATLLRRLTGDVTAYLIEAMATKDGNQ
ncbi:hypothetical protein [Hafnia alvei]|uniref:hypothetical protein n=1 Tax=Hafnia alvei TaxID=569 RepID=UPI00103340FF|nr:hypothetical protein [Hafnia alvei]TBL95265.1 hypothetical protein EYY90_08190 [Hafnia alvei]